jgi:tetratricopeptide (TPR) repeat protein
MLLMTFGERAKGRAGRGDVLGAVADFEIALRVNPEIQQDPDYANALLGRCGAYLEQKKFEPALADLERALAAQPNLVVQPHIAQAYCARAQLRMAKKKNDLALQDLARALEIDPKCAEAHQIRGAIHRDRMDFADALTDFQKAVQLDPSRRGQLAPEIAKIKSMIG